jgi:hypothetical protein
MVAATLFTTLVAAALLFTLVRGQSDHRFAVAVLAINVVATAIAYVLGSNKWLPLNGTVFLIDSITLCLFAFLCLRSDKLWPLVLTGWQLAAVLIHIASLFAINLMPQAYGIGQGAWAYLQFATIMWAVWSDRSIQTGND